LNVQAPVVHVRAPDPSVYDCLIPVDPIAASEGAAP
jgi:hypothetical protein